MLGFYVHHFMIYCLKKSGQNNFRPVHRHARDGCLSWGLSLGDILEGHAVAPLGGIRGGAKTRQRVIGEELAQFWDATRSTPDTSPPCLDGRMGKDGSGTPVLVRDRLPTSRKEACVEDLSPPSSRAGRMLCRKKDTVHCFFLLQMVITTPASLLSCILRTSDGSSIPELKEHTPDLPIDTV